MSIHNTLEDILKTDLEIDSIEIIKLNLVTNNKYTESNGEIRDLSKKVDNLINNVNFENIIQTPPF